jgi:hypothetical protein
MAEDDVMTERLLSFLECVGLRRTFADVAIDTGLNERRVRHVAADYIRRQEASYPFETPSWLGLGKIHILGKPRSVIANVQARCIIDMLVNRNKMAIAKYVVAISDKQNIEMVCMDMWRPYREVAAALLSKATVVVDKFHVVRMASEALRTLPPSGRPGGIFLDFGAADCYM